MRIPLEEVAKLPPPGAAVPTSISFSPDDSLVTFLHSDDGSLRRELFAFEIATATRRVLLQPRGDGDTEATLSIEEKLRRERQRELGVGVTAYKWADGADRIVVPLGGAVYVMDGAGGELREVVPRGEHPALDPRLSPDGTALAFVRDAELHVVDVASGEVLQLTTGARGTGRTNGLAEFIAQEEMARSQGYWWSRDSTAIAFAEVDETHIPLFRIQHLGAETPFDEEHRYPFAGCDNARVRLGVVPVGGGAPVWLALGGDDRYLARVHWLHEGALVAEVEDRDQRALDLFRFDPGTGERALLLRETADVWINLHSGFGALADGTFLWMSERTGFRHVFRHDRDGAQIAQLTDGKWMVDSVEAVDEESGTVWFTGSRDGVTERHLYCVTLGGGEIVRLTAADGVHNVVIDNGRGRFVDVHSAAGSQPRVTLRSLDDGAELAALHAGDDPRAARLALRPPALESFTTADGTVLYSAVYRPDPDEHGPGPYPLVVAVYGGPHAQLVTNEWRVTASMRAQHLRSRGYLVAVVDNRGSARRGLAFEGAVRGNLGDLEVRDQVEGVQRLIDAGLADHDRVGVYGWSYGGYMACMCLARAGDVFRAAVAGAPVTHWDGYDTHYTERYMGTPQSNPEGYERSSVMHHVGAIKGKLLLVHGLIDENVHFRHTARLVTALIRARVPYDLLLFPGERHSPRSEADRLFMEERISGFFDVNLAPLGGS